MQASQFGVGLIAAALPFAALVLPGAKTPRPLVLPAVWLAPLLLAGIFYEGEVKTASWIGYLILPMLAAYFVCSIWVVASVPQRRGLTIACVVANTPFAFLSALVTGCASSGTWL